MSDSAVDLGLPGSEPAGPQPGIGAPPAYFYNETSTSYVDQTGALRAIRTAEQLAGDRAAWAEQFDRAAKAAAAIPGADLSKFTDEARVAHMLDFDNAARVDGLDPVEPPDPELQRMHDLHLVPIAPKPSDFNFELRDFLKDATPEHRAEVNIEFRSLAAEIGFAPGLGAAFIERLVSVAAERKALSPEAKAEWAQSKRSELLARAGGEQAFQEQMARVRAELTKVRGAGGKLARAIAADAVINDWYLFTTLLNHSRAIESLNRAKGR